MPREKFNTGDRVVIRPGPGRFFSDEIQRHKGKVGTIRHCGDYCTDYHKASYEWFATVKLDDGSILEDLTGYDLVRADVVTQLGAVVDKPSD